MCPACALLLALAAFLGCRGRSANHGDSAPGGMAAAVPDTGFVLSSDAFDEGQAIPARYTCEGLDISPPLSWTSPPAGTRSLALLVRDPDAPDPAAPRQVWTH